VKNGEEGVRNAFHTREIECHAAEAEVYDAGAMSGLVAKHGVGVCAGHRNALRFTGHGVKARFFGCQCVYGLLRVWPHLLPMPCCLRLCKAERSASRSWPLIFSTLVLSSSAPAWVRSYFAAQYAVLVSKDAPNLYRDFPTFVKRNPTVVESRSIDHGT